MGARPTVSTAVYSYLECIDCVDGEFALVTSLGDSAVSLLGHFLVAGPPAGRVTRLRRHLDSLYVLVREEIEESGDTADAPTKQDYVDVALDNYAATYRARAAAALGRIKGTESRRYLDSARTLDSLGAWPPRPDVTAKIDAALNDF